MEIPIPDNYKPSKKNSIKKKNDHCNAQEVSKELQQEYEDDKKQTTSPASKSKDEPIKTHNSIERLDLAFPEMVNEVKNFLRGGIEWPTEFNKFIFENPKNTDEMIKSQTAWLAKASAYIAMHLKRWMEEKVVDEIEYGYKTMSTPFTGRVMEIKQACEDLLNVLPARLPAFQQRFREKYEQIALVAKKADEEQARRFCTGINSFKLAARDFHGIVRMIHSEAFVAMPELLNQNAGVETGGVANLASTKQNDLTDTESNILEALGDSTLHGPELLKKAGYDNSSHYRAILSGLVKRNILDRNARGYHLKSAPRQ